MSSRSTPIDPQRFAAAIQDLPLSNLHFKATEIRNSIAHLQSSNRQLQPLADEGDPDCVEAITENVAVMEQMEGRISLLKLEVERRGFRWGNEEQGSADGEVNGLEDSESSHIRDSFSQGNTSQGRTGGMEVTGNTGGRIGDEELRRRLAAQLEEREDDPLDEGVHL